MPTQKDLKRTRKLKRRADKVNNIRRNKGKQPLSFKHFYKVSHKRNRSEFESRRRNDDELQSPNKKRKFNNNKPYQPRNAPFGFGKDMDQTEPEYQRFLADINESDSDDVQEIDNAIDNVVQYFFLFFLFFLFFFKI